MSSIYFSQLIAMARIPVLCWNKSGENWLDCLIPQAKAFPVQDNWSLLIGKGSWAHEVEETYCGGYPSAARCLCAGEAHLTVIKAHRAQKASQTRSLSVEGPLWRVGSPVGTGISGPAGKENTFLGPTVSGTKVLVWGSPNVVEGTPMVSWEG